MSAPSDGARADARKARAAGIADDYRVPSDRESLGRMVRNVWVQWAREQDAPKPTWLVGWDDLPEPDREVDRRIGEALYLAGLINGQVQR